MIVFFYSEMMRKKRQPFGETETTGRFLHQLKAPEPFPEWVHGAAAMGRSDARGRFCRFDF